MTLPISELIEMGKAIGFFQFYLPFLLLFVIFYGILNRSKIFGDPTKEKGAKTTNFIISLVAAFLAIGYSPVGEISVFLANLFGETFIVIAGLLVIGLIVTMISPIFGKEESVLAGKEKLLKGFLLFGILIAIGVFFSSGGLEFFGIELSGTTAPISTDDLFIIGIVVFTGLIIWWLLKEEPVQRQPQQQPQQG